MNVTGDGSDAGDATFQMPKPSLTNRKTITIDPSNGKPVAASSPAAVPIEQAFVSLAFGPVSRLDIDSTRSAEAVLFSMPGTLDNLSNRKAIVFAHGFSQRPGNYGTLLRLLASKGFVVAAPRVWLFDVAWPWVTVEATGTFPSPLAKLQTAVMIGTA